MFSIFTFMAIWVWGSPDQGREIHAREKEIKTAISKRAKTTHSKRGIGEGAASFHTGGLNTKRWKRWDQPFVRTLGTQAFAKPSCQESFE